MRAHAAIAKSPTTLAVSLGSNRTFAALVPFNVKGWAQNRSLQNKIGRAALRGLGLPTIKLSLSFDLERPECRGWTESW